jgi:imidazolonepropionase-like amidohydrolase
MRRAHIGIVLTVVIGVVATGSGHTLGSAYLTRNASRVLTMEHSLGDGSLLGQFGDADVLTVDDKIEAVEVNLPKPPGVYVIDGGGMIVMPGFVGSALHGVLAK